MEKPNTRGASNLASQASLEEWTHGDVMNWFNGLPQRKRDKYRDFFENEKHFSKEARGKDLAAMREEEFIAILDIGLGADLYVEIQLLKTKSM